MVDVVFDEEKNHVLRRLWNTVCGRDFLLQFVRQTTHIGAGSPGSWQRGGSNGC
jgi:hypothetical protein